MGWWLLLAFLQVYSSSKIPVARLPSLALTAPNLTLGDVLAALLGTRAQTGSPLTCCSDAGLSACGWRDDSVQEAFLFLLSAA